MTTRSKRWKRADPRSSIARVLVACAVAAPTALDAAAPVVAADGPAIDLWCGDELSFGRLGVPQAAANVLGNVSDPDGVATISYSLNNGPEVVLRRGPDGRRLARQGDFNVELPIAALNNGSNDLRLTAVDVAGDESVIDTTVRFAAGNAWSNPYTIDWAAAGDIGDVAQVVDGRWVLEDEGLRIAETGYDRMVAIGDIGWTDYEVTFPVTINGIDEAGFSHPQGGTSAALGVLMRWGGHTDDPVVTSEPKSGWRPYGSIGWWWWESLTSARLQIMNNGGGNMAASPYGTPPAVGSTLTYRMRVETQPDGTSQHSLKVWDAADSEPSDWTLQGTQTDGRNTGSLLLLAHFVDATFGNITVTPLGESSPSSTESTGAVGSSTATCAAAADPEPDPGEPDPDPTPPGEGVFDGGMPTRLVDTRIGHGAVMQSHNGVIVLDVGADPAALNLTAVQPTGPGHFVTYPCANGPGATSTVNWTDGDRAVPNMVLATPDHNGRVCVKSVLPSGGRTHVVIDRNGTLYADGGFAGRAPRRLRDTRDEGGKLRAGATMRVTGLTPGAAVVLNLTAAQPEAAGHLTAYPCARGRPTASVANYQNGHTKANMTVVVADGDGAVCLYTHARTHLVVDDFGYIGADNAAFVNPVRLFDSRRSGRRSTYTVPIPDAGGRAAILNVTATQATGNGHATVYPCSSSVPTASNLNFAVGQTVANHVIISPSADGHVCMATVGSPHLVVDLAGYLEQRS